MGLLTLIIGLLAFTGVHALVPQREARGALIKRFGEGGYKAGFSLLSLLGILLIAWGFARYRASGWVDVWQPPVGMRHLSWLLMWLSIVLVTAAYIPGEIKRRLKHPMLVGVKLWALAHLLVNGDLGSIILFGSILAWAVYDRITLKHRTDPGAPPIPVGGWKNDLAAVAVGTGLYFALGYLFHPWVIGVPVFVR